MKKLICAAFAKFRRIISAGRVSTSKCLPKFPDECLVEVMLFLRRTDVDTAFITCRTFRRVLTGAATHLPLRFVRQIRQRFDYKKRRHWILVEEREGSPPEKQKIRRIGEWLSRLSHCYVDRLIVWAYELQKFDLRRFDKDIAYYQHVNFRVNFFRYDGKSGSDNFDIPLYNFLMQPPRHVPEQIEVCAILPDLLRLGLALPQTVETGGVCGIEILKMFLFNPHSYGNLRYIFASSHYRSFGFEVNFGFESVSADGIHKEAERTADGLSSPITVYRPLVNRFTGQKLRIMTLRPKYNGSQKFCSEEKCILKKRSGRLR